jgi:hypothetical protein
MSLDRLHMTQRITGARPFYITRRDSEWSTALGDCTIAFVARPSRSDAGETPALRQANLDGVGVGYTVLVGFDVGCRRDASAPAGEP